MSLLEQLRKNLAPEDFNKVTDALGDDFDYDVVPRTRLNEVIKQRNTYRKALEQSGAQSTGAGAGDPNSGEGNPGTGGGAAGQFTQADIDIAVQQAVLAEQQKTAQLHKRYAVAAKLQDEFVDPELILNAGLLDLDKVTMDDKHKITGGLDDQITSLKTEKPYMCKVNAGAARGTGKDGGDGGTGPSVKTREDFLKLSTSEQIAFKEKNPDVFRGFMNTF